MKESINRITLGIRHRRSFRVPEVAGAIVDYIIYDSSSPFEANFFQATDTLLDNFENKGRILIGKDSKSSIVVDTDNLVFNLASDNFDDSISKIKTQFIPFFKKIFKEFKLENINRVGMVFEFKFSDGEKINQFVKTLTQDSFSNTDRFDLRFSQKETDTMSVVKRDLVDYKNNIVVLSKTADGVVLKFDYQFHYSPEIGSINDLDFDKFVEAATERLESKIFKWLKQNEK